MTCSITVLEPTDLGILHGMDNPVFTTYHIENMYFHIMIGHSPITTNAYQHDWKRPNLKVLLSASFLIPEVGSFMGTIVMEFEYKMTTERRNWLLDRHFAILNEPNTTVR